MPISNGMNLAGLLGSSANIRSQYVAASVSTLADMDALIAKTGMAVGDQAYVQSNNKLYLYNGTGWYLVATVENAQPTAISGVESVYALASDGTATTITAVSEDPDGFPLTWSYAVTTGSLGNTATVSQADNVFTITPSTDEANAGEFSITFSVTDGATGVVSAVSAFTLAFGWTVDLSNVTYDNKSFAVTGNGLYNLDLAFNNDGTKMYVLIYTTDTLYQYSLTTAWDVSTASYDNVSFSFSSQDSVPYSFTMTPDGTKIIVQGNSNFSIFQYSLSTAFDLSTISYDNVSLSAAVDHFSNGRVRFGQNGEKMFMKGGNNVYQYSLSTAYDISTASYNNVSFDVGSQFEIPTAFAFDLSGTKMYAVGLGNTKIHQYTLSTGFDLSTASYDNVTLNYSSQVNKGGGMVFSQSGHKFYMTSDNTDTVYQYSTGL